MKFCHVLAALLLLSAATAPAAEPEQKAQDGATQAGAAAPTPPAEKRICKKTKVTGSLTRSRRTCMTESQWNDATARAKQTLETMVRTGSRSTGAVLPTGAL